MPDPGNDSHCALGGLASKPVAIWFELVESSELIAFKQPLLDALARPVAVGEIVAGPRAGTVVVIPTLPPEDAGTPRFTHDKVVSAFAAR